MGASGINSYITAEAGEQFSAKDFRTWSGTVYAAVELAGHVEATASQRARGRTVTASVKEVAQFLGNTPAVCRSSYIDPRIIDRFEAGESIHDAVMQLRRTSDPYDVQCAVEAAVLDLLSGAKAWPRPDPFLRSPPRCARYGSEPTGTRWPQVG